MLYYGKMEYLSRKSNSEKSIEVSPVPSSSTGKLVHPPLGYINSINSDSIFNSDDNKVKPITTPQTAFIKHNTFKNQTKRKRTKQRSTQHEEFIDGKEKNKVSDNVDELHVVQKKRKKQQDKPDDKIRNNITSQLSKL